MAQRRARPRPLSGTHRVRQRLHTDPGHPPHLAAGARPLHRLGEPRRGPARPRGAGLGNHLRRRPGGPGLPLHRRLRPDTDGLRQDPSGDARHARRRAGGASLARAYSYRLRGGSLSVADGRPYANTRPHGRIPLASPRNSTREAVCTPGTGPSTPRAGFRFPPGAQHRARAQHSPFSGVGGPGHGTGRRLPRGRGTGRPLRSRPRCAALAALRALSRRPHRCPQGTEGSSTSEEASSVVRAEIAAGDRHAGPGPGGVVSKADKLGAGRFRGGVRLVSARRRPWLP